MSSRSLPSRIGRYEILDRLGKGGMGVLYLARDPLLRRTLAIKVLAVDDDDLRERFAREARSAAALSHVNIVTIFDVGEDGGYPFLAMEYLDGETMAEMIRRRAPVTLQHRLKLVLELCAGLGYAHRLGIVHRDIKPANLMITSGGVLKILDFGLARLTQDTTGGLTQSGALLGTPNYMSPEQVQGRQVDQRSDIFSVGLVFYELLTYRKAYFGDGMHVILHKIVQERPQPLREVDPTIDPALELIVENAIAREPDQRYQSLELMAADTSAFLKALAGRPDADATVIVRRGESSHGAQSRAEADSDGTRPTPRTPKVPNFEGIARRREAQIQLHLDEAARHFKEGRFEQSIEQCELAAVLNPEDPRAIEGLSRAHAALEEQQIESWLSEAQTSLTDGALSRAEQLVRQSLERRPGHEAAQALGRRLQEARRALDQRRERERAVAGALERARAHHAQGAFEAAIRSASDALAFEPENAEAQSLKQQALDALERQRAIELEQRAAAAVAAARSAARAGDLDGAAALLDGFAPPHALTAAARAEVQGQLDARARLLAQASAAKAAARTAIDAGEWDAARLALQEASSAVPKDPELAALRGALATRRAEAEAAAKRLAALRQHVSDGGRFLADGDLAGAIRSADLALEIDTDDRAAQDLRSKATAAVAERKAEEERAAAERARRAREQAEREAREAAEREEQAAAARAKREAEDRAAREQAEREAREAAEREQQAAAARAKREAEERAAREQAEREAREAAERERQAAAARAKHEAEDRAAREQAERTAREAAQREQREAAERAKRETAERAAREQSERQARDAAKREQRAAVERAKRETKDRAAREQAEREARETAEREQQAAAERAKREAEERAAREQAEREARDAAEREQQAAEERAKQAAERAAREQSDRLARETAREQRELLKRAQREATERVAREAAERQARDQAARTQPIAPETVLNVAATEIVRRPAELVVPPVPVPAPVIVAPERRPTGLPMRWLAVFVVVGLISASVVFLVLRRSHATPEVPPPHKSEPSRTASDILQEARRLAAAGDGERALQVAITGYRDSRDQGLLEFVNLARSAAAKRASDAAADASGADASQRQEYIDAAAKMQQAAALTSAEDAPRAVALYADAEKGYRAAVTASSTDPAVFVRHATDAYKSGAIDRAIEYALTARRLDPAHAAADRIIDQIRRDSARDTARAKAAAVAAGATGTDAFARAEQRGKDAAKTSSPDDLAAQVAANKDAAQLYRGAATAAESARAERHAGAQTHVTQAQTLLSQKRLDEADAELRQATALEPQNADAQAVAKQLADARLAARIGSLMDQARGVDARQAVPLLEQAAQLDPSRQDVKNELQRRRDEVNILARGRSNPPPPPGPSEASLREADAAAIRQVLERYKNAWEAIDVNAVAAVYPGVNVQGLRESFKNVKKQPMTIQAQPPDIDANRTSATVRGHIASRIDVKVGSAIRLDSDVQFHLTKSAAGWRIVGIDYRQ